MKKIFLILLCLSVSVVLFGSEETRIKPGDLTYLGAFRLPDGSSTVKSWQWGGYAATFYPSGDPGGGSDGYPGSIFATGHAWEYQVSEISIPAPVISAGKNLNQLNTATTLQSFSSIVGVSSYEIPRVGLAYLPKQGSQSSAKIYFCRGQHLDDDPNTSTHGWFNLTLSSPQTAGFWYLTAPHAVYNSNDYMFEIPSAWASLHTPGKILATGRFRDGGWSGQGPALYAIAPWSQGNPPASGTALEYVELLRYTSTEDFWEPSHTMTNYHDSDEWSGAVWLTAGSKSAVIFAGTKGTGECWYGDSNGPCYDCEGERGWWSTGFDGQIIFYDPDDFAKVAAGTMESWEPQPYATLNVDDYLYHLTSTQEWYHLGAVCFDKTNGFLYVFEPYVDDDKPIVHVWKIEGSGGGGGGGSGTAEMSLNRNRLTFGATTSGVGSRSQTFTVSNTGEDSMNWTVSDSSGWLSCSPISGSDSGEVTVSVNTSGLSQGQYTGSVTVSSDDAGNSPQSVSVTLNVYSSSSAPFGVFSTPENNATVRSSVPVTGWVLDDIGIDSVKLYRSQNGNGPVYFGDAVFIEGSRSDVEQAFPSNPDNYQAGWGYMLLTNFFPNSGNGTFVLTAIATDLEGHQTTLGNKTIICDNANAVKPFGAIDTPEQGGTASGSSYINWGWALTPQPNSIPTDGSTITVWIDGVEVGQPTYNLYRSDIATLFPEYANSDGAVGYLIIDTTAYENGIHTIQWKVSDSGGNTDGIGSRYFKIQND